MGERRIERVVERERSVLFKNKGVGGSGSPFGGKGGVVVVDDEMVGGRGTVMDRAEVAAIEAELSPEQLQLFEEENESMVRYYEDTLSKVQYVAPFFFF
jgi:hypothetical protein